MLDAHCVSFASLSIEKPAPGFLGGISSRATYRASLFVGKYWIEICCTSQQLAAALELRYHDFANVVAARSTHIRLYVVREDERLLIWADPARVKSYEVADGDITLSVFLVDLVMAHELFAYYPLMGLHAAVVGHRDRIAAILGDSTAGKSTTTLACAALGFTFYSDERCVLEQGKLYPFPRTLTLRPGGKACLLADYASLADRFYRLLSESPTDCDIQIVPSVIFDTIAIVPGKLDVLFLIQGFAPQAIVEEVPLAQHLPEIMRAVMLSEIGIDRVIRVMNELSRVRAFSLFLGSPRASALKIQEVMHSL